MTNTNYDGIYGSDQNTNIIDARIVLKHDTLGNWNNSSIILDKGEIALTGILKTGSTTDIDRFLVKVGDGKSSFSNLQWTGATPRKFSLNSTEVLVVNELGVVEVNGTYLAKIGDGTTPFNTLKFLSGPASDVLAWAKQSKFPVYESGSGNTIVDIKYLHSGSSDTSTANTTAADATGIVLYRGNRIESVTAGDAITITGTATNPIINHADTSSQLEVSNEAKTVISAQKYDTFGHVTETKTKTIDVIHDTEGENLEVSHSVDDGNDIWTVKHTAPSTTDPTIVGGTDKYDTITFVKQLKYDDNGHIVGAKSGTATCTYVDDLNSTNITEKPDPVDNNPVKVYANVEQEDYKTTYTVFHDKITSTGAGASTNSGRTYIQNIETDGYGHITNITTGTDTDTKTEIHSNDGYIVITPETDDENDTDFKENALNEYKISLDEKAIQTLIRGTIASDVTAAMTFEGVADKKLFESLNFESLDDAGKLAKKGNFYKVSGSFNVTDVNQGQLAVKTGDTIVWDGNGWHVIPSGDDIEDTWRPIRVDGQSLDPNNVDGKVELNITDILDPTAIFSTSTPVEVELKTARTDGGKTVRDLVISHKTFSKPSGAANELIPGGKIYELDFDDYGHVKKTNNQIKLTQFNYDNFIKNISAGSSNPSTASEFITGISITKIDTDNTDGEEPGFQFSATKGVLPEAGSNNDVNVKGIISLKTVSDTAQSLINGLDVGPLTGSTKKTITEISQRDGKISAKYEDIAYPAIEKKCTPLTGTEVHDGQAVVGIETSYDPTHHKYVVEAKHGEVSTDFITTGTKRLILNCGTAFTVL